MRVNKQSRILMMVLVVAISITPHSDAQGTWMDHLSSRMERASSDFFAPLQPSKPNSSSEIFSSRIKRSPNDEAFNTLQSRISTLARVVTGVTLYNGLVDGSIPVDNAIAELMNAGSISFQDLENFKKDEVANFVTKATEIGGKLKPETATLEKALKDLAKIKEMWTFGDEMSKLPDAAAFDKLKVMETIDVKVMEDFVFDDAIKKLTTAPDIPGIRKQLEDIAAASKAAKTLMDGNEVLTTLSNMAAFHGFANILNALTSSTESYQLGKNYNQHASKIQSNSQHLGGLSTGDSNSLFSAMKAIVSSRSAKTSINRQYTSGLVNGYLDLEQLPKDAEDSWLINQYGWLKLKDGLTIISHLAEGTKGLSEQWSNLDKESTQKAIKDAEYFESNAKGVADRASSVGAVVTELSSVNIPGNTIYAKNLEGQSRAMSQLLQKGEAVNQIAAICEKSTTTITALDAANSDSIQNAITLLDTLKPFFSGFKNGKAIKEIGSEVMADANIYKEVNTNTEAVAFKAFLDKLKSMKANLGDAASVAELTGRLRDLKNSPGFSKDVNDASTTVVSSIDLIKKLRTEMESIKSSKSDKTNMLNQLNDLQKFSKPLGDSSALIDKIKKTLDQEKELADFLNSGHVVNDLLITDSLSAKDAEKKIIKTNWKSFDDVSQRTSKLLREVKTRKNGVVIPQDDKFESYGPILEKLGGLTDVRLDTKERLIAVGVVLTTNTDKSMKPKLDSLKASLVALAPLDLTFAQYSVAGMTDVLTGISKAFGGTAPTSTMRPVTKPVATGDNNSTDLSMDIETTPKPGFTWPVWGTYLVVGVVIIAVLCTIIYGAVYVYRRLRPKTVKIDDDSGSNSGEEKDPKSKTNQPNKNSKGNKQGGKKSKSKSSAGQSTSKSSNSTAASISKVETPANPATGTKLSTASTSNDNQNPVQKNGSKDTKASEISKDLKGSKDSKDSKASKDAKDSKDSKESKKPDQTKGSKETKQKKKKNQGKGKAESKAEPKSVDESQLRDNVPYSEGYAISERAPGSSVASARGASAKSVPKNTAKKESNGEDTMDDTPDIVKKTKN